MAKRRDSKSRPGGSSPSAPVDEEYIVMFKKVANFLGEVRAELSKVSWSTRQELMASTVVVISITAILAVLSV